MSKLVCPSCGEIVSSAEYDMCYSCGYKITEDDVAKQISALKQKFFDETQRDMNFELSKIDNMSYPRKPSLFAEIFGGGLFYISIGAVIISVLLMNAAAKSKSTFMTFLFLLATIACIIWTLFVVCVSIGDYKMFRDIYEEKTADWDGYKEKQKEYVIKKYTDKASSNASSEIFGHSDKCPFCGSKRFSKIPNSSELFFNYRCDNCYRKLHK